VTGIRELFEEYSGQDVDWFQLCFCWERSEEIRRERHRESQRLVDWRKRGGPGTGRRGRPSLGLSKEQMRLRRKKQNHENYLKRRAV
jgi:hypothetical protein